VISLLALVGGRDETTPPSEQVWPNRVLPCGLKRSDANAPIGHKSPRGTDGRNLDTDARHHFDDKTPWGNISDGKGMLSLWKCSMSAQCMLLEQAQEWQVSFTFCPM
jgi:hypothetical protein